MSIERVRICEPNVIHEVVEDEVVIVNLETGIYYSLRSVGAEIWKSIQSSASVDEIIAAIAGHYNATREVIENAVRGFIAELRAEALVVPASGSPIGLSTHAASLLDLPLPFSLPRLDKFTDLVHYLSSV